jgi:hypothetical protein
MQIKNKRGKTSVTSLKSKIAVTQLVVLHVRFYVAFLSFLNQYFVSKFCISITECLPSSLAVSECRQLSFSEKVFLNINTELTKSDIVYIRLIC